MDASALGQLAANYGLRSARSFEDLKNSSDILSGADSQTLRTFCAREFCNFSTDLNDPYGRALREADLTSLKHHFSAQSDKLGSSEAAAKEVAEQTWGPTKIPVYNVLLSATVMYPHLRSQLLAVTRYLISEAQVPVDGIDLSGTSALMHSISTKPYLDLEFAQLLLEAGADINHQNRYGCTAASDAVMARAETRSNAATSLKWFGEHGGDFDIKDGDGVSVRFIAGRLKAKFPDIWAAVNKLNSAGDGTAAGAPTTKVKVGRNDPCSCGSGKKYKLCCGKP